MLLQLFEVITAVYQYINLLKQSEPQEWIFKELQDIGYMEFRFAEEQPPDDYVVDLAGHHLFDLVSLNLYMMDAGLN